MNARTGEKGSRWERKTGKEEERGQRSKDKKGNREGRLLIEALEEAGWWIFNGRGKGDEEGEWTYAGGRGEKVLDYVMGNEEIWEKVRKIKVENRINSDHFPVVVWIKGEGGAGRKWGREKRKWEWSQEGKSLFREKLEMRWEGRGKDSGVE